MKAFADDTLGEMVHLRKALGVFTGSNAGLY
jgi:hypothetical protein